jgi:hypothetical protein
MPTRVVGIGGIPASGKSRLMREVMARLGPSQPFLQVSNAGPVPGLSFAPPSGTELLGVIGKYADGDTYPGTDRLSMAIQPAVLTALGTFAEADRTAVFAFEGDRLFNGSLIDWCCKTPGIEPRFFLLTISKEAQRLRMADRSDTKRATFVKGRNTKYGRLAQRLASDDILENETEEQLRANVETVLGALGFPVAVESTTGATL